METADFFRARIDAMLNLRDPLAVLARRLPWDQIEAAVAAKFERQNRAGQILEGQDLFGPTQVLEPMWSEPMGSQSLWGQVRAYGVRSEPMGSGLAIKQIHHCKT